VSLRSADPNIPADIDLNYVGHPEDLRRMVEGVRIAWRLMNSVRFVPYVKEFAGITREIVASDRATADFVRNNCGTIYHPTSTVKMGPDSDKEAVVDQYCRVRGIEGLRVVDASVMPNIVRANTNLTCIMIGERAAEIVHIGQAVLAMGGTIEYFRDTVFNYPTLAEAYKVAALDGLNKL